MTPVDLGALYNEFKQPPLNRYKRWSFFYDYPGTFSYIHETLPYTIYFTPDWDEPGEVSIQIMDEGDFLDGQLVPFLTGKASDLYAIIIQWLEYVEQTVARRGVLEWTPGRQPWKPRG